MLKLSKCAFFRKHSQYLGHFILGEVLYSFKENVCLVNLSLPNGVTQTRHIISLALYYRKFIANCSNIVGTLMIWQRKMLLLFGAHNVN